MRDVRKQDRLQEACRRAGVGVEVVPLDVTRAESIAAAAQHVHERHGALFALVNNAGYGIGGFFEDLTDAELRDQMETNFWGVLAATRAFLPAMRQTGRGYVINVSSLAGYLATPGLGAYTATKFALEGFSEGLWHEMRPFGVRVVLVQPGMIRTDIFTSNIRLCERGQVESSPYWARGQKILRRTMKRFEASAAPVERVSALVATILDTPDPALRYRVGLDARLMAGLKRVLPEWLLLRLIESIH
jgi:short-subunit dehydrogenase